MNLEKAYRKIKEKGEAIRVEWQPDLAESSFYLTSLEHLHKTIENRVKLISIIMSVFAAGLFTYAVIVEQNTVFGLLVSALLILTVLTSYLSVRYLNQRKIKTLESGEVKIFITETVLFTGFELFSFQPQGGFESMQNKAFRIRLDSADNLLQIVRTIDRGRYGRIQVYTEIPYPQAQEEVIEKTVESWLSLPRVEPLEQSELESFREKPVQD